MKLRLLILLPLALVSIKLGAQAAPLKLAGPIKNISSAGGFSLGAGIPFAGSVPQFGGNQNTRTGYRPDFTMGFIYGLRGASSWAEIGLSFNRYSSGYKNPGQDTVSYRLQSNYLGFDLRYCMSDPGTTSRNIFSITLTPGISLMQRNLEFMHVDGRPLFGEAVNYREQVSPLNIALTVSGGKELDFTAETTARLELFTRWNTVFTKSGQGVISQLAAGVKVSFLYTR